MMPGSHENGPALVGNDTSADMDSQPLCGMVLCCTSIPSEYRSEIASKTHELGGIHKHDLTPDVTHLLVGDYSTQKYRHVAKERPDILPMAAGFVEAVRALWIADQPINLDALEAAWRLRPLETSGGDPRNPDPDQERGKLLCCLTGFEDPDERQRIIEAIDAAGGAYTGDLTRKVSHLIAARPEGRKYAAARGWNVIPVAVEWLRDSAERGMILDEACYDPVLPSEQRGVGAWVRMHKSSSALAKRQREGEATAAAAWQGQRRRKLRKTASMKMMNQSQELWGGILGNALDVGAAGEDGWVEAVQDVPSQATFALIRNSSAHDSASTAPTVDNAADATAIFTSCCFYVDGFPAARAQIVAKTIASLGGHVFRTFDDAVYNSFSQFANRFVVVPQDSEPGSHPNTPEDTYLVTEFYIERCVHGKRYVSPTEHVLGRPFPAFPIPGFEKLSICTAGFVMLDLNQVDKAVRQVGARYEERFTAQCSMLVCTELSAVRKEKLELALRWNVPVVRMEWLWKCISKGRNVPIGRFMFKELKQKVPGKTSARTKSTANRLVDALESTASDTAQGQETAQPARAASQRADNAVQLEASHAAKDASIKAIEAQPPESESKPISPLSETSSNMVIKSMVQPDQREQKTSAPIVGLTQSPDCATCPGIENQRPIGFSGSPPQVDLSPNEQNEAAAAARLALSTKLASLLDTSRTVSTTPTADALPDPPPRRKREIFGRAISNISAASSGSADLGAPPPRQLSVSTSASLVPKPPSQDVKEEEEAPSRTQLEFVDEEAKKHKDTLMRRMVGGSSVVQGNLPGRLRLGELVGMMAGASEGGRRTRRQEK